ncbi:hypothetical protein WME90_45645 [Sorangium sp. So ce375]|uniref:hypothetical protein n=1 Tax=Sorangium sp. So ce375 TaxID=3133306 RepID=UPI003F5BDACD
MALRCASLVSASSPSCTAAPRHGLISRRHTQKIESHADPEIPGSEALAAFLLAPYVEMVDDLARSRRRAPARKPEAVPAPSPGAVDTP